MADNQAYSGSAQWTDGNSPTAITQFIAQQMINKVCTMTLVRVVAVRVEQLQMDVQPLTTQLDGDGNATPHGTIYNVPWFRLQGGVNAVIIDPEVNDIGLCVFAMQDISSVKANKKQSNPGSRRRYDWADGVYIGGILNAVPTRFVQFVDGDAGGIVITALDTLTINGNVVVNGTIQATDTINSDVDVTAGDDGISLVNHTHDGVETGGGNTGPPQ